MLCLAVQQLNSGRDFSKTVYLHTSVYPFICVYAIFHRDYTPNYLPVLGLMGVLVVSRFCLSMARSLAVNILAHVHIGFECILRIVEF